MLVGRRVSVLPTEEALSFAQNAPSSRARGDRRAVVVPESDLGPGSDRALGACEQGEIAVDPNARDPDAAVTRHLGRDASSDELLRELATAAVRAQLAFRKRAQRAALAAPGADAAHTASKTAAAAHAPYS